MTDGYREDTYVLCPYYRGDIGINIRCVGIIGVCTTSSFPTKRDLTDFKDDFCRCKSYQACPIYQTLDEDKK